MSKFGKIVVIFARHNDTTQDLLLVVLDAISSKNKALLSTCRKCIKPDQQPKFDCLVAEIEGVLA